MFHCARCPARPLGCSPKPSLGPRQRVHRAIGSVQNGARHGQSAARTARSQSAMLRRTPSRAIRRCQVGPDITVRAPARAPLRSRNPMGFQVCARSGTSMRSRRCACLRPFPGVGGLGETRTLEALLRLPPHSRRDLRHATRKTEDTCEKICPRLFFSARPQRRRRTTYTAWAIARQLTHDLVEAALAATTGNPSTYTSCSDPRVFPSTSRPCRWRYRLGRPCCGRRPRRGSSCPQSPRSCGPPRRSPVFPDLSLRLGVGSKSLCRVYIYSLHLLIRPGDILAPLLVLGRIDGVESPLEHLLEALHLALSLFRCRQACPPTSKSACPAR